MHLSARCVFAFSVQDFITSQTLRCCTQDMDGFVHKDPYWSMAVSKVTTPPCSSWELLQDGWTLHFNVVLPWWYTLLSKALACGVCVLLQDMFPEDHMSEQSSKLPSEEGLTCECMHSPPTYSCTPCQQSASLIPGHTHRHTVPYLIPHTESGWGSLLQPTPTNSYTSRHFPGGYHCSTHCSSWDNWSQDCCLPAGLSGVVTVLSSSFLWRMQSMNSSKQNPSSV